MMTNGAGRTLAVVAILALLFGVASCSSAATASPGASAKGDDDIGGVVMGPSGPEAGVWVIAETTDLPTRFARIVVTDHAGRYLIPDLPEATYSVWVRGYGLVDSPRTEARPGRILDLEYPSQSLQAVSVPPERQAIRERLSSVRRIGTVGQGPTSPKAIGYHGE
jgi:hypothetical protein